MLLLFYTIQIRYISVKVFDDDKGSQPLEHYPRDVAKI